MAYQALARQWRPKSFSDLKGQTHVTRALMNAIARDQVHHAFLFTGTRGIGKTTVARILAKALNCEQGILPEPCGKCQACLDIDAGRFVDLIEVDAASRTRVEDTRELLENVQYAPTQGRFKIYLIDEVHMLSTHSFNALLKTLEEPPAHVKFILATTDPERIPVTVMSRCLRFNLKSLSTLEIVEQLQKVLQTEQIEFESQAINLIAQAGAGSMRDAFSVLEQAIAYCSGKIGTIEVADLLGMQYQRYLPELLEALVFMDMPLALGLVEKMSTVGADFELVLAAVLKQLHELAIAKAVPSYELEPALKHLEPKIAPQEVQLLYQIGLMGQRDLRYAPEPRTGFEMTLLRMIAFRPEADSNLKLASKVLAPKVLAPKVLAPEVLAPEVLAPEVLAPEVPTPAPVIENDWETLVAKLSLSGLSRTLVKNCIVGKWEENKLDLILEDSQKACLNAPRQAQIQEALSQHLGKPIKLTITPGIVKQATPHQAQQVRVQERAVHVKQTIEQDETVQGLLSKLGATIVETTAK